MHSGRIALIDGKQHKLPPQVYRFLCVLEEAGGEPVHKRTLADELEIDVDKCKGTDIFKRHKLVYRTLVGHDSAGHYEEGEALTDFVMTEIDLLKRSNFRWCDLFGHDDALMATGFEAWGGVLALDGRWYAVGGSKDLPPRFLGVGSRMVCLAAADDWLNEHETADAAHKSRHWLNEPPTQKQLAYLPPPMRADYGLTRYQASCLLAFQFNKTAIQRLVLSAPGIAGGRPPDMRGLRERRTGFLLGLPEGRSPHGGGQAALQAVLLPAVPGPLREAQRSGRGHRD